MRKKIFLPIACIGFFVTNITYADVRPIKLDRGYYFEFDKEFNIVSQLTPKDLRENDSIEVVLRKFARHNFSRKSSNSSASSAEIRTVAKTLIMPKTTINISRQWKTALSFNADLSRQYLRMNFNNLLANSELYYFTLRNAVELRISRNIFQDVQLSLTDVHELQTRQSKLLVSLSYDF